MDGREQPSLASLPGGPLTGVRMIELGTLVAGPFAGRLLGDLGAEVIKVEAPGQPDPLRSWGHEQYKGRSLWWAVQSRNKKCVTLNLREAPGQQLLLELVREADVVLENFRPGTLERWNLGLEQMKEVNPEIILARVSGYGQTGPYASRAGFASVAEAMGGLRHINGFPDRPPPRTGVSLGDSLGGMFAALGILAALQGRDSRPGGSGQEVDVSLLESCFALMESALPEYDLMGAVRGPSGTSLKGVAPSNIFRSRDDTWVLIAANNDRLFGRLAEAMGMPDLAADERFATHLARGEYQEELDGIIAVWAAEFDAGELSDRLNRAGVVCGPVYTIADIVEDEQYLAREAFVENEDPELGRYRSPGVVPRFSETPGGVRWTGPAELGTHNAEVFEGILGMDPGKVEELREAGVV